MKFCFEDKSYLYFEITLLDLFCSPETLCFLIEILISYRAAMVIISPLDAYLYLAYKRFYPFNGMF